MEQQFEKDNAEINLYEQWQVIKKRKVLIFGLFLVVILFSALYSVLAPKIYRGNAILNIISSEESDLITAKEITDFWGKVDYEKRKIILPKTYPWVKDVQIKALKDSKTKIVVTIYSKKVDDIPKSIFEVMDYLNNLESVKMDIERDKEILQKNLFELSELLKSTSGFLETFHKLFKAGKLSIIGFDPIEMNRNVIETRLGVLQIKQKIRKLNKGLIEMAVQPYFASTPVAPKILRNLVSAGIVGLFLGIFLALLIEYVGNFKKNRSQAYIE